MLSLASLESTSNVLVPNLGQSLGMVGVEEEAAAAMRLVATSVSWSRDPKW